MELFRTKEFFIFVNGEHSLWWDRNTGTPIPKSGWDLTDADDPICLGVCDGIIGKVEHSPLFDPRLFLIKESVPIGKLHGDNEVFKIKSVAFLSLSEDNTEINLKPCPKHKSFESKPNITSGTLFDLQKNSALTKTWGTLKSAGNTIKNTTQQAAALATAGVQKKSPPKDKERFQRQIIEEFYKIFTDTNSFYYSRTTDLTNSLQRLCYLEKEGSVNPKALWKTVDDRFFWNKHMLSCLIETMNPMCDPWILPIIQGYIQIEDCKVEVGEIIDSSEKAYETFTLCILSRRNRFRAGTRYKRRGVDEHGEVANYVETEQIITYQTHEVSFVQVRGSVPVYWSQPGFKYRPPPRIDKGEAETQAAFQKHFDKEVQKYGPICVVNLVEQNGKENIIFEAYSQHVLLYNSPFLTYVTFDFHEYCRGMHFENVSILINAVSDIIKDMNYCWRDKQGHICSQIGVFRVNCIDCLDRTNVVQTALGKAMMEIQFCKLGLVSPEGTMPNNIKNTFQLLWANNGDIISKQYAGTNALKGDYTRTGERKFTGIMKDGMNSANRYLKSHFTDSARQCCLDIMHGNRLLETEVLDMWAFIRKASGIAYNILPEDPPSMAPHFALQLEYEFAHLLYQTSRYYLSRFKDSTRQGTIDIMLGNYVSEDEFNESRALQDEEDNAATAEHVKLLIEDCKKLLINQSEYVIGAWGLINADPFTGDPNETEMDTILILTRDSYFIADYDDQVDKITKYQNVLLKDVTMLEFGLAESNNSLFKSSKHRFCIRINYKVNDVTGYYHMFRSTHFRFFNNMAVTIKNVDEEIESLKAICESFIVAMEICGVPPAPFRQGQALDRRKSKIINSGMSSSNIYLDITSLPQMTRNVSESQLLSLKNVGSKAISNMTLQFSKLNKIGKSLQSASRGRRPNFTIGQKAKNETSSESDEEDYENSIFQPNDFIVENVANSQYDPNFSCDKNIEQAEEASEKTLVSSPKSDGFLPGVGIVMANKNEVPLTNNILETKTNLLSRTDSAQLDEVQLASVMRTISIGSTTDQQPPEIQINLEAAALSDKKFLPPNVLKLDKKFSCSSGNVEETSNEMSDVDYEVPSSISQSQSESALKNIMSPIGSATKDLMLSPFSKLAKGVQSFGVNLDPRKLGGQIKYVTEKDLEEHEKLQEKWQHSKTRLIAL